MPCSHPLSAWKDENVELDALDNIVLKITCTGCAARITKAFMTSRSLAVAQADAERTERFEEMGLHPWAMKSS